MPARLAVIINSASYERVAFGLSVAATVAAAGGDVHILFGHGAAVRLKKGDTDELGEETSDWMRERIRSGVQRGKVTSISELLDAIKKLGGRIYACPTALEIHELTAADLVEEVDEVRSLVRFMTEDAKDASIIYV